MPSGTPVDRQWIHVLEDGTFIVDWGDDLVQDLLGGDFFNLAKSEFSHPIRDDELELLRRAGRVEKFDARQVYIFALSEPPRRTID